jgi:hypothetical protein
VCGVFQLLGTKCVDLLGVRARVAVSEDADGEARADPVVPRRLQPCLHLDLAVEGDEEKT